MEEKNQSLLKRLKAEKLYRLKYEKYRDYVPNGKSEVFIRMVGSGDTFISLFSAANGVGKTAVGANILAHLMFPCNNPYFQYKLFRKFPFLKRGRIVTDPTTVKSTTINELKKWFPKDRYRTNKQGKNYEYFWETDTGWDFDVMTYDQNIKEFESVTLGWAWFDEPPPEAIFKATVSRMRRGGIIFITATPLTGSAWMYDQILINPVEGQRDFVEADVEANCKQHGVRGILEHEHIEKMIAEYSEEDKQARVKGKFQHLTGLVHKTFNRKIHVIPPFDVNYKDFSVIERLDPHPRVNDAVLWMATDKNGTKYVIDELWGDWSTEELVRRIKKKASDYRVIDRRADPWIFNETKHMNATENSLSKRLDSLGLKYLPASKKRSQAIRRVDDSLKYVERNGVMIRPPELYVFDTCERTIWEFEHWQWQEWSGKASESRGKSERPQDKDDHMMENLGRALIDEIAFVPYKPYEHVDTTGTMPVLDPFAT